MPSPYLLVGHSFGGLLSTMYAGSYPTEVVGLVLAATKLDDLPSTRPAEDFLAARKKVLQDFTEAVPRGELRYVDSGHSIHKDEPQLVIGEIQRMLDSVR